MDNIILLFVAFFAIGGSDAASPLPTPCTTYTLLNDTNERNILKTVSPTGDMSTLLCDDVPDGWYRLDGGEVAMSCAPPYSCGTRAPVWMNGTVPDYKQQGLRQFCVDHDVGHGQGSCCTFSFDMMVQNCGDFLVYEIKESKILCPMALCIGDLKACGKDEFSTSGFEPCVSIGKHPDNLTVELTGPTLTKAGFEFYCQFDYETVNPESAVDVTWMFDGKTVRTETVDFNKRNASFNSEQWIGHLGQNLSCSVRAYYKNRTPVEYTNVTESRAYKGAVTNRGMRNVVCSTAYKKCSLAFEKIVPDREFISEGEPTTILIESSLPIVCKNVNDNRCQLQLLLSVDGGKGNFGVFTLNSCNATLKRTEWNSTTKKVFASMQVTSTIDPILKENSTHTLDIGVVPGSNDHDIWKSLKSTLNLLRVDVEHADCFLFGENHIKGIYTDHLYSLETPGDFVMYATPDDSEIHFQIQTRQRAIRENLPSTCGVAIKHEDHIITIDMCNLNLDETEPLITQEGHEQGKVKIYQCGPADYELTTDSDIRVEVKVHLHGLEVYLHLPPLLAKYGHLGTCSYNGSHRSLSYGDYAKHVAREENNLFQGEETRSYLSDFEEETRYCDCNSNPDHCPATVSSLITDPVENLLTFCNKLSPPQSWTKTHPFTPVPPYMYSRPTKTWPTLSGINDTDANHRCENALTNLVPSYCKDPDAKVHPGYTEFLSTCVSDVKATDSFDYIKSSLQGFLWSCQISILKNPDLYMRNQNQYIPPAEVTSDLCHDFCNMHGQCSAGRCHCDKDYTGDDCGVKVGATPVIADILGGSACESHEKNCNQPVLFIRDVIKSNFTENITSIEIVFGQDKNRESVKEVVNVTFTSRYTLSIDLTSVTSTFKDKTSYGFEIAISNDGITYSKPVKYFVYDEVCHKCAFEGGDWICSEREDGCRIEGVCYKTDEANPQNTSQCCKPTKAILGWSDCQTK